MSLTGRNYFHCEWPLYQILLCLLFFVCVCVCERMTSLDMVGRGKACGRMMPHPVQTWALSSITNTVLGRLPPRPRRGMEEGKPPNDWVKPNETRWSKDRRKNDCICFVCDSSFVLCINSLIKWNSQSWISGALGVQCWVTLHVSGQLGS